MKPEAQRIAIAEACGYSAAPNMGSMGGFVGRGPKGQSYYDSIGHDETDAIFRVCPDYLTDLNAMHEAEKTLNKKQRADYTNRLNHLGGQFTWEATAAQRAEEFLRTIEKWEDDK